MSILDKLFRRDTEQKHKEWLDAHPGKESTKAEPMAIDAAEAQRMLEQMEGELAGQREKREQQ